EAIEPQEIYNLAAQSHVKVSFEMPEYTTDVTALGVLRLLDAVRELGLPSRVYQAGSSEMYGLVQETPQTERTPFHPRSPYGVSKVFGHWMAVNYREGYGLHVSTGETHSVREFLEEAFGCVGLDWEDFVKVDPKYFRPAEVDVLLGDPTKARTVLGWTPQVSFKELVRLMVDADLAGGGAPVRP